jgi:ribonucleotide monophosphatase NagD (HAD superfamily)
MMLCRLAEQLLLQQAQQMSAVVHSSAQEAFCGIFMVGDNPAADIRGANRAGSPWVSMLVRTGVYQERQQLQTSDEPQAVVDDVLGAVQAALHRWRQAKWHVYR